MNNAYFLDAPDPQGDFSPIAALLSSFETEPTSAASLLKWYTREMERGLCMVAAHTQVGEVAGFHCLYRRGDPARSYFDVYLIVAPDRRRQGLGARLYGNLLEQAMRAGALRLYARVRDNDATSLGFAQQRGFTIRSHSIEMALNLESFDGGRLAPLIASLQVQGFHFIDMAELGDGEGARRKLYQLNDSTAATTPGSVGEHPWDSFEDFNTSVCQSEWYRPEGQMVVIDTHTGVWAGMSAITRFDGADHAYNLFTGVDPAYRGRGLGQAVKVLALRHAARTLNVSRVCTNHNSLNEPMLAIDRKLGYVQIPGTYGLVKETQPTGSTN